MSKKRFRPLGDVIRMGLVDDGALLRYVVGFLVSADHKVGCRANGLCEHACILQEFVSLSRSTKIS